jgi:hypothetical protein
LLVLVEVDHASGFGDALLHHLEPTLQQRWLPGWGMSITALTDADASAALPVEVSLTRSPGGPHRGLRGRAVRPNGPSGKVEGLADELDALRNIFMINERAMFEFVVTESSLEES